MKNVIDFTEEMKAQMKAWKGQIFHDYIENGEDGYVTIVRFNIGDKAFDLDNDFVIYTDSDGKETEEIEFSCFSCVETDSNKKLQTSIVGGKCRKNLIGEKIRDVFIVRQTEKDTYPDEDKSYDFSWDAALMIQTERRFYVFWRRLIFNNVEVAVSDDMESAMAVIEKDDTMVSSSEEEPVPAIVLEENVIRL